MKIIDIHSHIYPEKIAGKAVKSVGEFYGVDMIGAGTVDDLIAAGRKSGVDKFVVHSVAVTKATVQTINDYIASECKLHNELIGFGTMHADFDDKTDEAKRAVSLGLKGFKIHPDNQKFNLDDKRMNEFYDFLRQNEIPVIFHTGDYRYNYSHPKRVKTILKRFPGLIVIAAHFGGWSVPEIGYDFLGNEDCYIDTSSSFQMLGARRAKELIKLYGTERVLFGTDYPMGNIETELSFYKKMGLSNDDCELIFYKNAERILKIQENEK